MGAGTFQLQCKVTDADGLTMTGQVTLNVVPVPGSISVQPAFVTLSVGGTQAFTGSVLDQFSYPLQVQPDLTNLWMVSGGGNFSPSGVFTATTAGPNTFIASVSYLGALGQAGISIPQLAQTITFPAFPNKVIGDPPFAAGATASSGLPITYFSGNPAVATISGSTVTITGVGTSLIMASQPGDASYAAADFKNQVLTVNQQSQSITFVALPGKTFGNPPFALAATASSGLTIGYTSSNPAVATVSGSTVTIVGAGNTIITAAQPGNATYAAAPNVAQTLTVAKASQTITFAALPVKTFGNPPFGLSATASSGLTVSYASSNPAVATVSGSTLTITGGGTATITASQPGNANYAAAPGVSQTLTVSPAAQTISFAALPAKAFGSAPFALTATASSGLAVGYASSNPAVATTSGSTVTITGGGTTTITASQPGSASYAAAPNVVQILTVTPAAQTITFAALPAKVFGNPPFGLSATASSGLVVSYATSNPAVATVSGSTLTITGGGMVTITASQPGNASYAAAPNVAQTLTVSPAAQTIAFAALSAKTFGNSPFALTATASSGLTVAYTSSNVAVATVSGSSVTIVGGGSTTITAMQAGNASYSAAPNVPQTLSVAPAAQTITFAALPAKTFGNAPFALTGTASSGLTVGYSSSNIAVATVSGSTLTIVGAGAATITASQAGNANYTVAATVAQTLTVAKAAQTITFAALPTKTVGDPAFALAATASSGLATTYTSSNTAVATVSGSTATVVAAGTTTITAAQAGNGNYNAATSVAQTLTVKKNQTITFAALAATTYGNAPFALTATASSGLTVAYASSTTAVATVSGATVTIIGAGSAMITASQAGDGTWNAAPAVPQTLTVAKAAQTITFAALAAKTYGDAPFALTATASSGLGATYTSSNTAVATVSGSTVTIVGAGTSTITAAQAGNANYNAATSVAQTLTVAKAAQTITFAALTAKTYGDAAFTLTATASSSLGLTYTSSNTAVATVSGATVTIVGAGTSTITAAQAGNANYNAATSVTQTLTVAKAAQTITFAALTAKTFGNAPFALTATASSGLGITYTSSNTAVATVSGSTLTIVGAGTSTITAAQAGNANFNAATSVAQALTVAKAAQTITFAALPTKSVGDPAFALTATASSGLTPTYTSSNTAVATVSGSTVTIVAAGTTIITAAQAGNANYNAATSVAQGLTVKKGQTITFAALPTKTLGDPAFALTATASSGLAVAYASSNTAVATVSGSTVTIVSAGTATITASQAGDATWNAAAPVAQTLTVAKKAQTITFAPLAAKTYGNAPFTVGATASSGLTVAFTSSNSAVATVSGTTVTIVGGGTATITASQPGDATWAAATAVGQTLTVNKAAQTITFAALPAKTFGNAPFIVTATASSGLAVTLSSSNTAVATISGLTITITGGGTATITAAQAGNANYAAATSVTQSLPVAKAAQAIAFAALPSKTVGDPAFTLGATASSGLTPTYTCSNTAVATVSGATVTIVAAGSATITAAQAGDANYNAATSVAQAMVVKKNQTITFAALPLKNAGDAAFTLTASTSSGLAVAYASSNTAVATVSGATLTIVSAGSATITASQAGDGTWNAAAPVAQVLTVNAKPTVAISSPANGVTLLIGSATDLTASAADADGTVSKVEFFDGGTSLGAASAAPFTVAWTPTVAGSHTLTAKATDNRGAVTTSAAVTVSAATTVLPTIGFLLPTASAGEGDGSIDIPVQLSQVWAQDVTVHFAATGGTATGGGDDYLLAPATLTIPSGQLGGVVTVAIRDDATVESNETVVLTLSSPTNAVLGAATHTLTIVDNEAVAVQVIASDPNASEAGHQGAFTIARTGSATAALTVNFTLAGTATKGSDYSDPGTSVTIPAGATSVTIPLIAIEDALQEPAETVVLTVATGPGYALGAVSAATVTIADNDLVTIAATTPTAKEGTAPTAGAFTISRAGSTSASLVVGIAFSGTAATSRYSVSPAGSTVTIAAGKSTAVVTITPINDSIAEGTQTVVATLQPGAAYSLGGTAADVVSIVDDDVPTVTVTASDAIASEPGGDTGTFTVTRSAATSAALTVPYLVSGTATSGADYVALSGMATIPANATSTTITVTPLADQITEPDETVVLTLGQTSTFNAGGTGAATVTIKDCTVSIVASDAAAAEPAGDTGAYTLTRTGSTTSPLTVSVAWSGTALPASDFTTSPSTTSTFTFVANAATAGVTLTPKTDTLVEGSETATLTILSDSHYAIAAAASATVTIADATLSASVDSASVREGGGAVTFTVTRTGSLSAALTVPVTMSGTATDGTDYVRDPATASLSFAVGSATATMTLTPQFDGLLEGNETATMTIGSTSGYALSTAAATLTIIDADQPVVTVAVSDASCSEAGPDPGAFTITRSVVTASPLVVALTRGGTATAASDYTSTPSSLATVTIPANASSATVTITPIDDAVPEPPETVTLAIASGAGYITGAGIATLVIADNDTPQLTILATSPASEAGGIGALTVSRIGNLATALSVKCTVTGTATPGSDYVAIPATFTIPAGAASQVIPVTPIDDALVEGDETVTVALTTNTGYTLGSPASATVTIADNDQPTVAISALSDAAEGVTPVPGHFNLTRTGSMAAPLAVKITMSGTASDGVDYTRSFAGTTATIPTGSGSLDLVITPLNDALVEGDESVIATLGAGTYVVPSDGGSATLTIADDEKPTLSINATTAVASEAGLKSGVLTVTRSAVTSSPLTVTYAVHGSATPGLDYVALPGSVTIPSNAASATIAVTPRDDSEIEPIEYVTLDLIAPANATVGAQGTATIQLVSDDLPLPVVDFQTATTTQAQLIGHVPVGLDLAALLAATTTSGVTVSAAISGDQFVANVTSPAGASATVLLAFRDTHGVTGPSSSILVRFGVAPGGGPITGGDPTRIDPIAPRVTVTFVSGLTGVQHEVVNGELLYFTNLEDATVSVQADPQGPGTITNKTLTLSDGRNIDATAGPVDVVFFEGEGRLGITASATASNNGVDAVGTTDVPTVLVIDWTPPVFTVGLPPRYWPAGLDAGANPRPFVPLANVPSLPSVFGLNPIQLILNGMDETSNMKLRKDSSMNFFSKAGFSLEARVEDASGLRTDLPFSLCIFEGQLSLPTVIVANPDGSQRLDITGFGAIPEFQPTSSPQAGSQVVGTYNLGSMASFGYIEDRAGNPGTLGLRILAKTTKPTKLVFGSPDYNFGMYWGHDGFGDFPVLGPNSDNYFGPLRFVVSQADAIMDAWQDVQDNAHQLLRLQKDQGNGPEFFAQPQFQLLNPVTSPPDTAVSAHVIVRDTAGNLSDPITITYTNKSLDLSGFLHNSYSFPPLDATRPYHDETTQVYKQDFGIQIDDENSAFSFFGQTPLMVAKDSGVVADKTTLSVVQTNGSDGSTDADDTDGGGPDKVGQLDLSFGNQSGLRYVFGSWHEVFDYQPVMSGGTLVSSHASHSGVFTSIDSTILGLGDTIGFPQHELVRVSAIDVGSPGETRRVLPGVLTVPPSWQASEVTATVRIRDDGIGQMRAISPDFGDFNVVIEGLRFPDAPDDDNFFARPAAVKVGPSSDSLDASVYLARRYALPWAPLQTYFAQPGFSKVMTEGFVNSSIDQRYGADLGFRWIDLIQLRPDFIPTGGRTTLRFVAGFVDENFHFSDFSSAGDYVHFLLGGADVTLPISQNPAAMSSDALRGRIAIVGERLVSSGSNATMSQILEVDVVVGADVAAGIYDVDVKCGAIKAYPDSLSQNFVGKNGAHRMLGALCLFTSRAEVLMRDENGIVRQLDAAPQAGIPVPQVTADRPQMTLETDGRVHIALTGTVKDGYSETVGIQFKALKNLEIWVAGQKVQDVALTYGAGHPPWTMRSLSPSWHADVYLAKPIAGGAILSLVARNQTIGTAGYEDWTLPMTYEFVDDASAIVGGGATLALQPVSGDATRVSVVRATGSPASYSVLGTLVQISTGTFTGPLTAVAADGSATAVLTTVAAPDWQGLQVTATLRVAFAATGSSLTEGSVWQKNGTYFVSPGAAVSQAIVRNGYVTLPSLGLPVLQSKSSYEESASFIVQYHYANPLSVSVPALQVNGAVQTLLESSPITPVPSE
jgi:hypothetical protein